MADSNKTEQPTGKRVEKARTEGQYATSRDLVAAANFLVFIGVVGAWFPNWLAGMKQMLRQSLEGAFHGDLTVTTLPHIASDLLNRAFVPLSMLAVLTTVSTLAINLAVTKMGFSFKKLMPDFTRLNPASKIKNIVSQGPTSVLQACAMLVLFSGAIYLVAKQNAELFLMLPFASLDLGLMKVGGAIKDLLWKGAGIFLVFGLVDLFRQRRRYTKSLRMSKQEVKEEAKESDVSPQVKGKIRRMRRDLARRRMMKDVATATAVIVNPTHYAVALRYQSGTTGTPVVVAKGKNYLALRIRKIATDHGVPLVENPPLAQALYKSVEVGHEIPPALYRAVAEVLAYIYRLTNTRLSSTGKRK